jgi:hypothetical protein
MKLKGQLAIGLFYFMLLGMDVKSQYEIIVFQVIL